MTIAKRLYVLISVPVLIVVLLGLLIRNEVRQIDERSRFLAENVLRRELVREAALHRIARRE